jgi:hypothetical protein
MSAVFGFLGTVLDAAPLSEASNFAGFVYCRHGTADFEVDSLATVTTYADFGALREK